MFLIYAVCSTVWVGFTTSVAGSGHLAINGLMLMTSFVASFVSLAWILLNRLSWWILLCMLGFHVFVRMWCPMRLKIAVGAATIRISAISPASPAWGSSFSVNAVSQSVPMTRNMVLCATEFDTVCAPL